MLNGAPTIPVSGGEPLLYVVELLHRISNGVRERNFIGINHGIARVSSHEAKSALKTVIEHLVQLASTYRVLLPPVDGTADLGEY